MSTFHSRVRTAPSPAAHNEHEERLGINGFPAEGGLFSALLEATGLHRKPLEGWRFVAPEPGDGDTHNSPLIKSAPSDSLVP